MISRAMTTSEAARWLGVTLNTLRRWTDEGHIRFWRTPGNQRRYDVEDLKRFLEERKQ